MKRLCDFLEACGVLIALMFGALFFMKNRTKDKENLKSEVDKMNLTIKLKDIEAESEIEVRHKNISDRDLILDAIDAESRRGKSDS